MLGLEPEKSKFAVAIFYPMQILIIMNDYGKGRENKACGESNNEHNIG